jgi:hypothetical protein
MQPLPNHACPLCGGTNSCAAAASGSFESNCWCRDVAIPPDLLDRIPEAQRGKACVCAACIDAAATCRATPGFAS